VPAHVSRASLKKAVRLFAVPVRDDKTYVPSHIFTGHWRQGLLIACWLLAVPLARGAAFPRPTGYVNDFASVLDEEAETYLETFLQTLERETSAEVVVATVGSLEGMSIEEYANGLFAEWKIGKAQEDNGLLLLVAPDDRAVRIEVGYGLESLVTDGLAGEIIRTDIIPEFRRNNYPRGIGQGLNHIALILRGDPRQASSGTSSDTASHHPPAWVIIPFLGTFVVFGGLASGLGIRTKTVGPILCGGLFAGIPLLIATTLSLVYSLAVLLPLALAAMTFGYRKGQSSYWRAMLRTSSPDSVRDTELPGWVMGGTSGSATSGSSDGGGSSSSVDFGGGSSGGGGATGRW
jgi:uncharacterized protein